MHPPEGRRVSKLIDRGNDGGRGGRVRTMARVPTPIPPMKRPATSMS